MIIKSLLDTDFYKFTMGQVVFHKFPDAIVKYKFKCRNPKIKFSEKIVSKIGQSIRDLEGLKFKKHEIDYLNTLKIFKPSYLEFLRLFRFNDKHVTVKFDKELEITVEGPWFTTIYYEVPILAIVSEVYNTNTIDENKALKISEENLTKNIEIANNTKFFFADFGTRRRFSYSVHEYVIKTLLSQTKQFIGTSNVYFSHIFGISPIGTMAHEFLQAAQQLSPQIKDSQKFALQTWANEYRGKLGIALTDVISMDAFLQDFDLYFAKLFDGARHDSGDPYEWCNKLISHYKNLGVDPKTKTAVFSDSLNFKKAEQIFLEFKDTIKVSFGIGQNLTNGILKETLNIIMKMVECNGNPVAKISDSPGKKMCEDENYLFYLKSQFNHS